ncbi:hypothetical protein [Haloarcula pelagica]|uniref:hypothetical protein n=1 Tax=Haloarcula pelagica TaxID=3033389 RepID=UPI0024C3CD62|nr:hypothetical protein [Halomicroarcula sp. YJ-61-S]
MTQNTNSQTNSHIDRRTVLGLVGSGMTALAGCISGSSSTSENSTSSGTEATPTPKPGDATPIESISYTSGWEGSTAVLFAEITLADDASINRINLISQGKRFSKADLASGETKARLKLADVGRGRMADSISQSENTLVLIGENSETDVPFTYRPNLQFKQIVKPDDHPNLTPHDGFSGEHLGVVIENTGTKPALIEWYNTYNDPAYHASGGEQNAQRFPDNPIIKGQSESVLPLKRFLYHHWNCPDLGTDTEDAKVRISMACADDITIKFPLKYKHEGTNNCRPVLTGEARTVSPGTTHNEQ